MPLAAPQRGGSLPLQGLRPTRELELGRLLLNLLAVFCLTPAGAREASRLPSRLPAAAARYAEALAPGSRWVEREAPPARGAPIATAPPWSRLVVPEGTWGGNHGSSIAELPGGELLITWFAGEREGSRDSQIYQVRFDPETKTHSAPSPAVRVGERPIGAPWADKAPGNSALFVDDEGVVWLFWAAKCVGGWAGAVINYKTSKDEGRSWGPARRLVGDLGNLVRTPPLRLDRETFLLPAYTELWTHRGYACLVKHRDGEVLRHECGAQVPEDGAIQPALARGADGAIVMLLRNRGNQGIRRSWSRDSGRTWSPLELVGLPNPNAAVALLGLADGRLLLAYNHSDSDRTPLSLALSEDQGRSFRRVADLESGTGEYSYPAMVQGRDGSIHVTYTYNRKTIKHAILSTDWLDAVSGSPGTTP